MILFFLSSGDFHHFGRVDFVMMYALFKLNLMLLV